MESVELFLGDVPQFEVVEGPADLGAITLHGADIREVHYLRNRALFLLDTVQDRLVQLQLNQSLQEVVLLGSHVHTVEDPQEVALGDTVAWPQLAVFRLSGLAGVIPDLGQAHHSGRSEASADAGKARGIKRRGTGKNERPHRLRQPRDRDRVLFALADSQGGANFLRDFESMGLTRDQRHARKGSRVHGLFGFLAGRQEVQRDAGKVAIEPPQRRDQNDCQKDHDDSLLPNAHFARCSPGLRRCRRGGLARDEMALTLGDQQRFKFLIAIHSASSWSDGVRLWVSWLAKSLRAQPAGPAGVSRSMDERAKSKAWGVLKCRGRTRTSGGQTGDVDTGAAKQRGIPPCAEQPR